MLSYDLIHEKGEDYIIGELKRQKHKAVKQQRIKNGCIFDVYDPKAKTAYEVLTAKIVRSAHEQDEAIVAKMFRYLLYAEHLKFYLVSFNHEELEMFHNLGLEHWHLNFTWDGELIGKKYHGGKAAEEIAQKIFKLLISYAPLREWTREKRRKEHPAPEEFKKLTKKYGLPEHFLIGLWRDWRLQWVWKLEKILPKWCRKLKVKC